MGAPTEVYVDPAIAANSGTGTIGDPYGDLQYALDTKVRDSSNGDRFNVKAGTDEVLAAALTLATYGTPAAGAELIIEGYTSAAGDGGIGVVSGAGSYTIWASTGYDFIQMKNMKFHNCGSNNIVYLDTNITALNCEFTNASGTGRGILVNHYSTVVNCYAHNCAGVGISAYGRNAIAAFNRVSKGASYTPSTGIYIALGLGLFNEVYTNSTKIGINIESGNAIGNSIWSNAGTGTGIVVKSTAAAAAVVLNNIIEGFSGSGGKGISIEAAHYPVIGNNAFYNNATNVSDSSTFILGAVGTDQTLSASPFVDAANGDMRLKPGVLRSLGWPQSRKGTSFTDYRSFGAIQSLESMRRARAVMIG
jgi:hypothetical protein